MLALQLFVCVSLLALQSDAFRLSNYNHQHQHKPVQARRDLSQLQMYSHRYSHTHSPAAIATSCRSCRISSTQRSPLRATGHRLSLRLQSTPTDEQYEEWLDDMIYSGDIAGFIRRRSTDLLSEDFKDFLEEKLLECEEEDEKDVLSEIIGIIDEKLRQTDGMSDSGVAYESRLDKILFTPPNARRDYITEKIEEMTAGFVGYVQKEMKSTTDTDSKVVLASILQLIGQVKNTDLLGNNAALLKNADASLGDQFAKNSTILEGGSIADSKNLMGGVNLGDRNEQILAGLIFSKNDVLEDVLNNLHEINDDFVKFLEDKIDGTTDVDERVGLGSLLNTIKSVLERVKEVESEGSVDVQDEELDIQQVKARMKEIQSGKEADPTGKNPKARSIDSFKVKADKRDTFLQVLSILQNVPEGSTQEHVVQENYDLCDYQFMEMLKKEADDCFKEGADIEGQQYLDLLGKINEAMAVKIGSAQQRLERILAKRDLKLMEAEATLMTRKGEVDEALVLLMEANAQQAKAAGATQAAEVITKLVQKIRDEQERSLPDEQRLLRALMRIKDSEERKGLIYQAFKPAKSANEEGEIIEGPPLISPPAFINMVRLFIQNFGNVDSFDIMGKAQLIIDEAQIVATDLYGEGMTPQQQQKFMFEKNTLSVWDLANYEEQALMSGEDIPWANDAYNDKNPEDVLGERVKRIGGME